MIARRPNARNTFPAPRPRASDVTDLRDPINPAELRTSVSQLDRARQAATPSNGSFSTFTSLRDKNAIPNVFR
jgi:hypothetical protein